ncbi:MAG: DNA ligase, partial [Desulfovibrionales bacterium]|nr:DNA ligase [Desulfovibrionales bacterium]
VAALGIEDLGKGDSRKLLEHFTLSELLTASPEQIKALYGFGELTARRIAAGMRQKEPVVRHLLALGFVLRPTGAAQPMSAENPFRGKHLVFTGKMSGSREAMQEQARAVGALVQSSVNAKTDFLICGQNVGASKLARAEQLGIPLVQEEEYLRLLGA